MLSVVFFLSLLGFIALRVPIAFALGFSSLIYMLAAGIPLQVIPQVMAKTFDSFVLLAIPFFMLAGQLMNSGGITNRIYGFAKALTGHIRGGLSHVNVVGSMIFAGMSGSAVADASGIGQIEIRAMIEEGFEPDFAAAVTAASATVGPIIPPSIPMVIYGSIAGVSIGSLFVGGAIPGTLMGAALMVACYVVSVRRGYPRFERASLRELMATLKSAILPLLTPGILLGGLLGGVFTPTEAAVVAVLYAVLLGFVVYRELPFSRLGKILLQVVEDTASIMFIVSTAAVAGWILAYEGVPQALSESVLSVTTNKYVILLILNAVLLAAGCFMEATALILILTPVLLPVIDTVGIDRVHFGVVMVLNLMIGLITPPVGVCLYVCSKFARVPVERTIKSVLPFFVALVVVLLVISFLPSLVTFLPSLVAK